MLSFTLPRCQRLANAPDGFLVIDQFIVGTIEAALQFRDRCRIVSDHHPGGPHACEKTLGDLQAVGVRQVECGRKYVGGFGCHLFVVRWGSNPIEETITLLLSAQYFTKSRFRQIKLNAAVNDEQVCPSQVLPAQAGGLH